jgi:predicted NodU family carbamoyl transferase
MMLGLPDWHNAPVALLDRSRIISTVQEERLTRVKSQGGMLRQAISDVFSMTGIAPSTIGKMALNGAYMTYDHWDRGALRYVRRGGHRSAHVSSPRLALRMAD